MDNCQLLSFFSISSRLAHSWPVDPLYIAESFKNATVLDELSMEHLFDVGG